MLSGEATDTNVSREATDTNVSGEATDTNVSGEATDANVSGEATDTNVSGEATDTNVTVFGFTRSGLEPTIYRTRGEHANQYTTDTVLNKETKDRTTNSSTTKQLFLNVLVTVLVVDRKFESRSDQTKDYTDVLLAASSLSTQH
jgi:hypothetical protein